MYSCITRHNIIYCWWHTRRVGTVVIFLLFAKRPLTVTQRYQERFGRVRLGGRRQFFGDPSSTITSHTFSADGTSVFARVTAHDGGRTRASPAVLPPPPTGPHPLATVAYSTPPATAPAAVVQWPEKQNSVTRCCRRYTHGDYGSVVSWRVASTYINRRVVSTVCVGSAVQTTTKAHRYFR